MATAYASGPISFTVSTGQEIYVPLSAIGIDASGKVALASSFTPVDKQAIEAWLQYLFSIREIVALPDPPPTALELTAQKQGAGGNRVSVSIGYLPGTSSYSITATQRDAIGALTAATVANTVNALDGGLVQVVSAGSDYAPSYAQTLTASSGALTSTSALVLASSQPGSDGALMTIEIDSSPKLTVTWTKTVTVVPPLAVPPPSGQKSQKAQIDAAFAFVSVTSTPDTTSGGAVVVPVNLAETPFTSDQLALPAAAGTALTLTSVPASSTDTNLTIATDVTAKVDVKSASYDLTITRTDTYSGANLTPGKLAAALGTTGDATNPATTGSVTGGLVVVRSNGATPPASFEPVAAGSKLAVRAADGRFEIGLVAAAGLKIAPSSSASALATKGDWAITVTPTGPQTFSIEATYSTTGSIDTSKSTTDQQGALTAILDGLLGATVSAATPTAALLPQGGRYGLGGGDATKPATLKIPARS